MRNRNYLFIVKDKTKDNKIIMIGDIDEVADSLGYANSHIYRMSNPNSKWKHPIFVIEKELKKQD